MTSIGFAITEGLSTGVETKASGIAERVFRIFSDTSLSDDEKLGSILHLSLQHFELELAVVGSITGPSYTVSRMASTGPTGVCVGDVLPVSETPASRYLDHQSSFAFNGLPDGETPPVLGKSKVDVRRYISAVVNTSNGPFGTVCFASHKRSEAEFTDEDLVFVSQVAGWLGYLLGTCEQLELMDAQNAHYQSLFESVPAIMFLCDSDGLIISASNHFAEQVGLDSDLVPGKMCLKFFHANDRTRVQRAIAHGVGDHIPAQLLTLDQSVLEVELNLRIKPIGTMQNVRMVIASDVSARNEAFRAANEKNRLLEVANESLNQFAAVASHDLQEPLLKIQQFTHFLEEDLATTLTEDNRYHLKVITDSTERMSKMIIDLLYYSRTSASNADMGLVDLNSLFASIENELDMKVKEVGGAIRRGSLPNVSGNEPLLRQLFTNLLSNALKYRSPERKPQIDIEWVNSSEARQIVVRDNGIGFDSAYADEMFELFSRLNNSTDYKGTGIGLAICATVCEKHGWGIEATGELNKGAVFTLSLPTPELEDLEVHEPRE